MCIKLCGSWMEIEFQDNIQIAWNDRKCDKDQESDDDQKPHYSGCCKSESEKTIELLLFSRSGRFWTRRRWLVNDHVQCIVHQTLRFLCRKDEAILKRKLELETLLIAELNQRLIFKEGSAVPEGSVEI